MSDLDQIPSDARTSPPTQVVQIKAISKHFGGQLVLHDINATLRRGEVVLLRGDNGSGKTTLLNILSGNLEADGGELGLFLNHHSERFTFPLSYWRGKLSLKRFAPDRLARLGIGRTWQEMRLFSSQTVLDNLALAAPLQRGERPTRVFLQWKQTVNEEKANNAESIKLLSGIGLSGRENSSVDRISLGQAKRVAIMRAIRAGAKILLLDEPLAGLDRVGAEGVLTFLHELVAKHEVTLVIVEHVLNIPLVLNLATTIWSLEDGRLSVCNAAERSIRDGDRLPQAQALSLILEGSKSCRIQDLGRGARLIVHDFGRSSEDDVFCAEDIVVRRGRRLVIGDESEDCRVNGISFCLRRGEVAVLEAPNGWGKTTLIEALAGVLRRSSGKIRFKKLSGQSYESSRSEVALLQARNNVFSNLTVSEHFRLAGVGKVTSALSRFANIQAGKLSGGEKQSVAFELAIGSHSARVFMLDEPFSALDEKNIQIVSSRIRSVLDHSAVLIALPSGLGDFIESHPEVSRPN